MKHSSLSSLKTTHSRLGGNKAGFRIVAQGRCITTKKPISVKSRISSHTPKNANWSYHLVKGKIGGHY